MNAISEKTPSRTKNVFSLVANYLSNTHEFSKIYKKPFGFICVTKDNKTWFIAVKTKINNYPNFTYKNEFNYSKVLVSKDLVIDEFLHIFSSNSQSFEAYRTKGKKIKYLSRYGKENRKYLSINLKDIKKVSDYVRYIEEY